MASIAFHFYLLFDLRGAVLPKHIFEGFSEPIEGVKKSVWVTLLNSQPLRQNTNKKRKNKIIIEYSTLKDQRK